jgi:hypothetical protein
MLSKRVDKLPVGDTYYSGIGNGLNFREVINYGSSGASEFNDVEWAGQICGPLPRAD